MGDGVIGIAAEGSRQRSYNAPPRTLECHFISTRASSALLIPSVFPGGTPLAFVRKKTVLAIFPTFMKLSREGEDQLAV
jgi:hypothetical protein